MWHDAMCKHMDTGHSKSEYQGEMENRGEEMLGILQTIAFASMHIFNDVNFAFFFSFIMLVKTGNTLQRTFNTCLAGQPLLDHHLTLDVGKR